MGKNQPKVQLYSRGMGGIGLPGDFSSSSRFVRAAFLAENICEINSIFPQNEQLLSENVNIFSRINDSTQKNNTKSTQIAENKSKNSTEDKISAFFHLADSISLPYGAVLSDEGMAVYTIYTSCADLGSLTYYLTSYTCRTPHAYRLTKCDDLVRFRLPSGENIQYAQP